MESVTEFAGIRREALRAEREARAAVSPRRRFENLLDRHEARLRRVAFGMLADAHRVDDVLQEAFLKAYRALPDSFENERVESAWLYRIVHRCCLDELRRRKRRREVVGVLELLSTEDEQDASLVVAGALARLTPQARAVVLLIDLIGLDYDTAATALGVPRGTVASRLHDARRALREVFDA
jgi:RNA polymerase sigma-70 factor, ECF subfamily